MKRVFSVLRLTGAVVLHFALIVAPSAEALAQGEHSQGSVTADTLRAKIAEVEATADLDEETRNKLVELHRRTISYLEQERSHDAAAEDFRRATQSAPEETKAITRKLGERRSQPIAFAVSESASLSDIEQALLKEQANLAAVEAKLADLDELLKRETGRPAAVRKRLTEVEQLQEEAAADLKLPPPAGEAASLTEARGWMQNARARALSAEIRKLDQELLSQPVRVELLRARRDEEASSVERIRTRVKQLEEMLLERRRAETEQAVADAQAAKLAMAGKHPVLWDLVEQNAALSKEIASLTANLERLSAARDEASKEAKRIQEDFERAKEKLEVAGLSHALGMLLFEQRRSLASVPLLHGRRRVREDEIGVAGLRQIRHREELRRLRNVEEYVGELVTDLSPEEAEQIREDLDGVAAARAELLDRAVEVDRAYVRALSDLDFAQRQLREAVQAYDEYLAGWLLWVRSAPPPSLAELRVIPGEVALLVSPASWLEVLELVVTRLSRSPAFILLLLLVGALIWKRPSIRRTLRDAGQHVGRPMTDRFGLTLQALLLSLLLAAPWPLLVATFGWLLRDVPEATDFPNAVSIALLRVAVPFFYLRAFRVFCDPGGLAVSHFSWPEAVRRPLRREFRRLMASFLPLLFVAVFLFYHVQVGLGSPLERVIFIALTISLAVFFYGLFEPRRGALQPVLARDPTSVLYRLRLLWFGVALAVPALLIGIDLYGYLYTAGTLISCMVQSVWLVFALVFTHQLAVRWLTIVQRRLHAQEVRERHEAVDQEKQASEAGGEAPPHDPEESEVDVATLSDETRKLLNSLVEIAAVVGLWLIWRAVVPAFDLLNDIALWYQTVTVGAEEQLVPITLADVGLAVIIGILTFVAAKRFPAFLEILLRQRLEMTAGALYTLTTLSRYLVVATGMVLAFSTIGFEWSQIQWLVAALGVGIGFGLQEIVANFISGLIILFERPIRVGDVVTVGDADGVVTRIRIRATTIRTWERKELLVPNKEFVTGRLLNWSLSDRMIRINLGVGVAYGSDVQKAMALIVEAAEQNDRVLEDPKPFVVFDGFGDNALSLTLRCYVGSLEHRLEVTSELHQEINRKFNAAGIVIAFPQRDVHFDAPRPLDIRIRHDDENAKQP